jgi:hypothetical protein
MFIPYSSSIVDIAQDHLNDVPHEPKTSGLREQFDDTSGKKSILFGSEPRLTALADLASQRGNGHAGRKNAPV